MLPPAEMPPREPITTDESRVSFGDAREGRYCDAGDGSVRGSEGASSFEGWIGIREGAVYMLYIFCRSERKA